MRTIRFFSALYFALISFMGFGQWQSYNLSTTLELGGVQVFENGDVLISGAMGFMRRSMDCGATWQDVDHSYVDDLGKFYFIDEVNGYVLADDAWLGTASDGGQTWTFGPTPASDDLEGIYFLNADIGFLVGKEGNILRTDNGGSTWTSQSSGTNARLHGVYFTDADHGVVCGRDNTLLVTENGGASWAPLSVGASGDMKDIDFAGSIGYIAAEGGLYRIDLILGTSEFIAIDEEAEFEDIYFRDENVGWACGNPGVVIATNDGGQNWIEIPVDGSPFELAAVHGVSFNTAFTVGDVGKVNGVCSVVGLEEAGLSQFEWSIADTDHGQWAVTFTDGMPYEGEFRVYDISGAQVYQQITGPRSASGRLQLNRPSSPGIYMVSLMSKGMISTKKVIVR